MNDQFKNYLTKTEEVGFVEKTSASLTRVSGLPGVKPYERVVFENGEVGQVLGFNSSGVEVLSFSKTHLEIGSKVARTGELLKVRVGEELLGEIINPLGRVINSEGASHHPKEERVLEVLPTGIVSRAKIKLPCHTGTAVVDLMIPIGRGQRELIVGDQKTGKSNFALRALFSQTLEGAVGIYAVIGKSQVAIKEIQEWLSLRKINDKVILVVSGADDPSGMVFLTPFTAMTIAEYFRDQGKDVVLVLDDLTTHAKAYREISLLGGRFPGRNSYPGDMFYTHARLLERAGNFITKEGEAAITCFPVAETIHGDITGYIQTNAMSMTDGHIFFDRDLYIEGRRPAVDPFLSVTRVGRQTQTSLEQEINNALTAFLKELERVHNLTSFGADLAEHTRQKLDLEARILLVFDQTAYDSLSSALEIVLFGFAWGNFWSGKNAKEIKLEIQKIVYMHSTNEMMRSRIEEIAASAGSIEKLLEALKLFIIPEPAVYQKISQMTNK